MRNLIKLAIGAAAIAAAVPASAAMYSFSFTPSQSLLGTPYSGSGVFTTSDTAMTVGGRTAFAITSITGMVNGSAIVAPTATSYGNYFTTGGYFLDGSGVRFNTAAGTSVSFFNQSNNNLYRVNSTSPGASFYVNATSAIAAVPEPASWAMMVAGFGAVGGVMRRKQRAQVSFA